MLTDTQAHACRAAFDKYPGLHAMLAAYIRAAIWSSVDDTGEPIDDIRTADDVAQETKDAAARDCAAFYLANRQACDTAMQRYPYHPDAPTPWHSLGHDFWLTRNQHGVGFWDRSELEADGIGQALTDAAHAFGEVCLYIGDDGKVHA